MLKLLPLSMEESGKQRCYLPAHIMEKMHAFLNHVAEISHSNKKYLCTTWPREDDDAKFISFDKTVYLVESIRNSLSVIESNSLTCNNIKILKRSKVCSVSVSLIASSLDAVVQLKSRTDLCSIVKQVLYGIPVAPAFTVDCIKNHIGKLYGISSIVINSAEPVPESFLLDSDVSVKVDQIISSERHEYLKNNNLKPLGGLQLQHVMLKEIFTLIFHCSSQTSEIPTSYLPKCAFLHGPPGCGKTALVKQVAQECNAYLIYLCGAEVLGSMPGESEENLRRIFDNAVKASTEGPVVLFLDELDSICTRAKSSTESRALTQLVSCLDKLEPRNLVVVGASNRPGTIDPVIRRAGRFEREIIFGIPTIQERRDIFEKVFSHLKFDIKADLNELAESTPGYVGADIISLCEQACYCALAGSTETTERITVDHEYFKSALHSITPSSQRGSDILVDYKPVYWSDIGGLSEVKHQLQQAVEWPLKHPESFVRLGLKRPKGILLYGPPGCAKTTLVRAAATSCHVTFLSVSGAQIMSPYVGDSERKISEVFRQARAGAPTILFIDEIDSVVGSRSSGKQSNAHDRLLSTLLNEMDGVGLRNDYSNVAEKQKVAEGEAVTSDSMETVKTEKRDVLVVAATNRPDMLDDALIRPGRIDRIIYVPPPDEEARLEILKVHTKNTPTEDVDLESISKETVNYTGADLENICREASLLALTEDGIDAKVVRGHHFKKTLLATAPSLTEKQLQMYKALKHQK